VGIASDHSREHPGQRAAAHRLHTPSGYCYVKMHRDPFHWENEVHAYERWTPAFGNFAPRLLAVRSAEPLALVIGELPGKVLEGVQLSPTQERAAWRSAGQALVALHNLPAGTHFGSCRRNGTYIGPAIATAEHYIAHDLEYWQERGIRIGCLSKEELAVVDAAQNLLPAFKGEPPIPCHRDYCPANWLVTDDGSWTGVIDFEFAHWDVRVADFTRYPDWNWINRPDLVEALFEGYGCTFTPDKEQQLLVAHTQYALSAIVWGEENAYHGFAAEGRQALQHLAKLLA
jgi:Ser/Thr protein kinase RdoA (MazF antagonist)